MEDLRKIDALVAEHVMGLTVDYEFSDQPEYGPRVPALVDKYDEWGALPFYSSDIAAAWEVIDTMCPTRNVSESWVQLHTSSGKWVCNFHCDTRDSFADTAPLAICLAALKARGIEP